MSISLANSEQMRKLVDRALDGIELLPVSERIDLHQAAAAALDSTEDSEAAEAQAYIARMLSEAERLQLKFRELLRG